MSVFEYIIFGIAFFTFFPFFLSIFLYVPFYVHLLKKYDPKNSTGFNLDDWWDPTYLVATMLFFIKARYKKSGSQRVIFHGNILTFSLGYSGVLLFLSTSIIIGYLLLVGPTYQ